MNIEGIENLLQGTRSSLVFFDTSGVKKMLRDSWVEIWKASPADGNVSFWYHLRAIDDLIYQEDKK